MQENRQAALSRMRWRRIGAAGLSILSLSAPFDAGARVVANPAADPIAFAGALAQPAAADVAASAVTPREADLAAQLELLRAELAAQRLQLEALRRALDEQGRSLEAVRARAGGSAALISTEQALAEQHGAGRPGAGGAEVQQQVPQDQPAQQPSPPAAQATPPQQGPSQAAQTAQAQQQSPQPAQAASPRQGAVGVPPSTDDGRPPEVAPLFEQPGVLTARGKYVLEPSMQFGYSSSNRVALVGYTIIPALLIGLIDVRELKRNTFTGALTARYGVTNRAELELRVPYVYRSDTTVSREVFTGTAVENAFGTSGKGLGDIEVAGRYQLNDGGVDKSYYVAGLRFKSRSGRDPFEVVTDCVTRCVGENVTGTGLPLDLPTGSGFYSLQPSVTWLFPSDPAVFFGSVSYLYNFKRDNVYRQVLGGERELLGTVAPGDVIGFNFGMGLALNDKASLSLGYDHNSLARTRQNGQPVPGSVRTQLGTLLMGFSYRLNERRTLNVSVGAGLTRDTPDVSISVRLPMTF